MAQCQAPTAAPSAGACRTLIYQTSDGGTTWRATTHVLLTPKKIQFVDPKTGWLIGSIGESCGADVCPNVVMLSTDAGATWNRVSTVTGALVDEAATSANDYWALGRVCKDQTSCTAVLVVTTSAGNLWDNRELPLAGQEFHLQRLSPTSSWISGVASVPDGPPTLLRSTDAGATWATFVMPCHGPGTLFDFATRLNGWLLCQDQAQSNSAIGALYRSDDGGRSWQAMATLRSAAPAATPVLATPTGDDASGLVFTSVRDGWISLSSGRLLATHDGGQTWLTVLHADEPLAAIQFVDPQHGSALGNHDLWLTSDAGATWHKVAIISKESRHQDPDATRTD
jgi:photosystem II stability/assembly factor-like uncharacterized protein